MRNVHRFEVHRFGPIGRISLTLGDLTVLVGGQGTGKSIALQLLALALDGTIVARRVREEGLAWSTASELLDVYLGTGLGSSWGRSSRVRWNGKQVSMRPKPSPLGQPKVAYVPAQRAITIADGWPRTFTGRGVPYVVRELGLALQRILLARGEGPVLPPRALVKTEAWRLLDRTVLRGGTVALRHAAGGPALELRHGAVELPPMAWSTGQRELVPLLLALDELLAGPGPNKHPDIDWIVLEEPELGLHPEGIVAVAVLILELVHRGYRVVVSTHHHLVLDVLWLIGGVASSGYGRPRDLLRPLGLTSRRDTLRMADDVLAKDCRVYGLVHGDDGVISKDLSTLDPTASDQDVAGWGGLTEVAERFHEQMLRLAERIENA